MFNEYPCIICASGNSIPFDNKLGIDLKLKEIIETNVSFGINYFSYYGCKTTTLHFNDDTFYAQNVNWLKDIPLIIGRKSDQLCNNNKLLDNTILLPSGRYYYGEDSWKINNLQCRSCNKLYKLSKNPRKCDECKSYLMEIGIYHSHLSSLFTLTLAILLGFKDIYLLGLDHKEINSKTHFYQDLITDFQKFRGVGRREKGTKDYKTSTYNDQKKINEQWYAPYKEVKNVNVYNVSPESVVEVFPKIDYREFYKLVSINNLDQNLMRMEIKQYILDKTK